MYRAVGVYNVTTGDFLGFAIKNDAAPKLQSGNLWGEDEMDSLGERLAKLNDSQQVMDVWPDGRDPDVLALLENEDWEPLEKEEQTVIDKAKSYLVYEQIPELDERGEPTGKMMDGPNYDQQKSVIRWKTILAARGTDVAQRQKKAQEAVARSRMK